MKSSRPRAARALCLLAVAMLVLPGLASAQVVEDSEEGVLTPPIFSWPPPPPPPPPEPSLGLYSFPYEAGTRVKVSRDHLNHTPVNRIDMHGEGGSGTYRVVAAAAGVVRFVVDSHSATGACADNNYVWIEHPNGEWTKYSHLRQGSASNDAALTVGEQVTAGQFIGIEDDVGCARGEHVHFEVAVPHDLADPIEHAGGYIRGINRIPRVCGIAGNTFVAGTTYSVPSVRPDLAAYAPRAVAHGDFQAVYDAAVACGYRLEKNDGFEVGGVAHFNPVFVPDDGTVTTRVSRRLTQAQLDERVATLVDQQGFSLAYLDAYAVGAAVRYSAIFQRSPNARSTTFYYGLSATAHQSRFDELVDDGMSPLQISVASVNGARTYAALYTDASIGKFVSSSFQTAEQFRENHAKQRDAGLGIIALDAYVHHGEARYAAIWAKREPTSTVGLIELGSLRDQLIIFGRTPVVVTATHLSDRTVFSGIWR